MSSRQLVLIRHATAGQADRDRTRPLTPPGRRDARAVGEWLAGHAVIPDLAVVSPALRTRQTWDAAVTALPATPPTTVDERLYDNTAQQLLAIVRETSDEVTTLALVGHYPSTQALALPAGSEAEHVPVLRSFSTSTVVVLGVEGGWRDFDPEAARVIAAEACRADRR